MNGTRIADTAWLLAYVPILSRPWPAKCRHALWRHYEEIIYTFCTELLETKEVSDATFEAAETKLGERRIVELIGVVGYYQLVALLLNVDRYPLPDNAKPELRSLDQKP